MIYLSGKSLFIHIPRTGGRALSYTVVHNYSASNEEDPFAVIGSKLGSFTRHATAYQLKFIIPDFHTIEKLAVIRNPWRIAESHYRYFHRYKERYSSEWSLPFPKFVQNHFAYLVSCGGFWNHWAGDWDNPLIDLGVKVFRFESLDDAGVWSEFCRAMNIPGALRESGNEGASVDTVWDDESVEWFREACRNDISRFGYPSHPEE